MHWPISSLDGNDRKWSSEQWTYWYIETLYIFDRRTPSTFPIAKATSLSAIVGRKAATGDGKEYNPQIVGPMRRRLEVLCSSTAEQCAGDFSVRMVGMPSN